MRPLQFFNFKKIILLSAGVFSALAIFGQQGILSAGIEYKRFIPLGILNIETVSVRDADNNFDASFKPIGGYGLGMVVRYGLSDVWSIESGITLNKRKYAFNLNDRDSAFSVERKFQVVGYEIPVKALAYIKFTDQLFMNTALGLSTDFIASDVESIGENYSQRSFKNSWIQVAFIANLGVEWRSKESGYFYLGASYHNPINDIMTSQVNYYRNNTLVGFANTTLRGNYFSLDLRYFFKPKKNSKRGDPLPENW